MKRVLQQILICVLTGLPCLAIGQIINPAVDTIQWNSTSESNFKTRDRFTREATFVTYGTSKIELIKGGVSRNISVNSFEGSWADLTVDGKLTMNVSYNGIEGTFSINRSAGAMYIIFDLTATNPDGIFSEFEISDYVLKGN